MTPKYYKTALEYLKKDKKLTKIIDSLPPLVFKTLDDPYFALLASIASQQLSVKAADTIFERFCAAFPKKYPTPKLVIKKTPDELRAMGLSYQKANYMQNVAQFALDNNFSKPHLNMLDDEAIIAYLTPIKGVGKWTVQMLLLFEMQRPDIFAPDDLGIQQGMQLIYNIKSEGKQLKLDMEKIAAKWQPYRSIACRYVWRAKDLAKVASSLREPQGPSATV
jgi:DNA-3-methyladenine glycosylase II